jgi:hypothetical protein
MNQSLRPLEPSEVGGKSSEAKVIFIRVETSVLGAFVEEPAPDLVGVIP